MITSAINITIVTPMITNSIIVEESMRNDDIWEMDVNATTLPTTPFLPSKGTIYYGLTISPENGDVYVADAIDYVQQGKIYRYSASGDYIDEFYAGIIPGAFCWKK